MAFVRKAGVGGQETIFIFLQAKSDFWPKVSLNMACRGLTAEKLLMYCEVGGFRCSGTLSLWFRLWLSLSMGNTSWAVAPCLRKVDFLFTLLHDFLRSVLGAKNRFST